MAKSDTENKVITVRFSKRDWQIILHSLESNTTGTHGSPYAKEVSSVIEGVKRTLRTL